MGLAVYNPIDHDECLFDLEKLDERLCQSSQRLLTSDEETCVQVFEPGSDGRCSSRLVNVV